MTRLYVDIKGQPVPLSECDWVMYRPCGCTCGVLVAYMHEEGTPAFSEEQAWKEFEPKRRGRELAQRQGYRLELVTHKYFVECISATFLNDCAKCRKPKQQTLAKEATP